MRVLLIEDSDRLRNSLATGLRREGLAVDLAGDGEVGLARALSGVHDVIVLDLMLPGLDGLSVLRKLREAESPAQILILTARDSIDDRVQGLRSGADDYLTKPFAFEELLARIETLARRRHGPAKTVVEVGDLRIDMGSKHVSRGGEAITLTRREYSILELLALRRGEVVSRTEIEDRVYGEENFPVSNAVASAISTLRSRLDAGGGPSLLHTRRGLGWVLDDCAP